MFGFMPCLCNYYTIMKHIFGLCEKKSIYNFLSFATHYIVYWYMLDPIPTQHKKNQTFLIEIFSECVDIDGINAY